MIVAGSGGPGGCARASSGRPTGQRSRRWAGRRRARAGPAARWRTTSSASPCAISFTLPLSQKRRGNPSSRAGVKHMRHALAPHPCASNGASGCTPSIRRRRKTNRSPAVVSGQRCSAGCSSGEYGGRKSKCTWSGTRSALACHPLGPAPAQSASLAGAHLARERLEFDLEEGNGDTRCQVEDGAPLSGCNPTRYRQS